MKATVHWGREQDRDGLINVATWPDRDDAWGWGFLNPGLFNRPRRSITHNFASFWSFVLVLFIIN